MSTNEKFIGISAFAYTIDFAHWILKMKLPHALSNFVSEFPNPKVSSIREACDLVCTLPFLESLFMHHRFTSNREASGRCFDLCFIAETLAFILGSRMDDRVVDFVFEAKGNELEWTLGYYLKHHVSEVHMTRTATPDLASGNLPPGHNEL